MANDFYSMTPAQLEQLATNMLTAIGTAAPNPYGVPADQLTSIDTNKGGLAIALQAVTNAKSALHAAVQTKDGKTTTLVKAISAAAKTIYANPAVTDTMIADAGLSPRQPKTNTPPVAPASLMATPNEDGSVQLKWKRNGNTSGTTFVIEIKNSLGEWEMEDAQTASKALLTGYTPGLPQSFRVRATKKGISSAPSNVAVIYQQVPAPPQVQLKAA